MTTVKIPLNLVFDVPEVLQSSNRKFFIIRAHKDANGTITAEKLEDEDTNPATITVTSDKFSTYAIAYTEEESSSGSSGGNSYVYNISASASEHGAITPEGKVSAYYGSAKTFSFTPDEGYKVADVIVDGVSVGAVSSYTFDNIVKAHTISVTFEPIADDQDRIINGIKATTIKASSAAKKGSITIKWKKSAGFKMDYFQVFRSTKMNSGYGNKAFYTTKTGTQKSYKNTKNSEKAPATIIKSEVSEPSTASKSIPNGPIRPSESQNKRSKTSHSSPRAWLVFPFRSQLLPGVYRNISKTYKISSKMT